MSAGAAAVLTKAQPDGRIGGWNGGAHLAAAAPLCQVHCLVGADQQRLAGATVIRIKCHADAAAHAMASRSNGDRLRQLIDNLPADAQGHAAPPHPRQQDHKFITAKSGDGVTASHCAPEPGCNGLQHRVTDVVTVGIIDLLKPVQIDKQHGENLTGALRFSNRAAQ